MSFKGSYNFKQFGAEIHLHYQCQDQCINILCSAHLFYAKKFLKDGPAQIHLVVFGAPLAEDTSVRSLPSYLVLVRNIINFAIDCLLH